MRRVASLLLLWLACCTAFANEQRIALVIGNAAYRVDPLDNPVNDARLVAASLKQAAFDVTLAENLDRRALLGALRAFGERLNDNSVAVLYYAGHGLQLRDRNYLIPIDAEIRSEDEIPLAGIDLTFILARMSAAKSRINIVILDACRNNPLSGGEVVTADGRRLKFRGLASKGLAAIDAPAGTMVALQVGREGDLFGDAVGAVRGHPPVRGRLRAAPSLLLQEGLGVDACLLEDCAQSALGHVAGVIRDGRISVQHRVEPDFVTAGGLPMELETQLLQPPDDVAVAEARQRAHQVATISG